MLIIQYWRTYNEVINQLCNKLYLKYGCFTKITTEYQLIFIISTTAYIGKKKYANKEELVSYLNEPVQIELKKYNII